MKVTIQAAIDEIVTEIELSDEQINRCFRLASEDAEQWKAEAAAGNLPKIEEMEIDWSLDTNLKEAGVTGYAMQRLSFAIAWDSVR